MILYNFRNISPEMTISGCREFIFFMYRNFESRFFKTVKQFPTIEIRQLYTELMASSYRHTFSYLAGIFSQPIQVHLVKIGIIGGN